ncbi:MAG: DegV family protein [Oscillospiraceae bacterium]|nr:DegV family protein [Oscillospiraceae bacterium]
MNRNFVITADETCDLPAEYLTKRGLDVISLQYEIDGVHYKRENALPPQEFYNKMRSGAKPITSQANPDDAKKLFEKYFKEGKDILHIAFSSGLSGTYQACNIALNELKEEYPDRKFYIVDSLCASLGEGLLVHYALNMYDEGKDIDEIHTWLEDNKLNLVHLFTVDDLFHLHRGGRVSKSAAIFGSMLSIKPILHVDDNGKLIPLNKVRGRKQSITHLADMMGKQMGNFKNDVAFICHGDCIDDAEFLASIIKQKYGVKEVLIGYTGSVIASHSGPGTLALFFMGDKR